MHNQKAQVSMAAAFAALKSQNAFDDPKMQQMYQERLDELREDPTVRKIWAALEEVQANLSRLEAQPWGRRARFRLIDGGLSNG